MMADLEPFFADLQEQTADRGAFLQEQGQSSYTAEMRSLTRGLWTGAISWEQAFELGMFNIRVGLTNAWHRGMASVGLQPSDMSPDEQIKLRQIISEEINYLAPFLDAIEQGSKANGGKLGPLMQRAAMWANRFRDVENQARQSAKNDPKLVWRLGPTEHCVDCANLADKVKRASSWQRANIRPQMPELACQGFRCQCILEPTELPLSKGPLPRLRGPH